MAFLDETPSIRILSVLELRWEAAHRGTPPRPFHALSFRLRGDAEFFGGDVRVAPDAPREEGRYAHALTGDVLFVPRGMAYTMHHGEEHLFVVHFETDERQSYRRFELFSPHDPHPFAHLFRTMYATWERRQTGYVPETTSLFLHLLAEIQKESVQQEISSADRLQQMLSYMQANFQDSTLSVASLAERFGTSASYFRRVFGQTVGTSPAAYLHRLRVDYARELLATGYYSVREIAERSGFCDAKYFSKVIRREFHAAPSHLKP